MDEHSLKRRQVLGGMAMAAGAAGVLGTLGTRNAAAADAPAAGGGAGAGVGTAQAPTITDVKDKVVYITGGSSGIGLGIARVMHEYGAKVVIGNLDDKQFADALKNFPPNDPRLFPVVHDVLDRDGWQRTADAIEKKFGPVDILVNNAGVGLQQSAATGSLKDWEWGLGVNLWGPIHGVNTFVPRMLARKTGAHIVTTTSTSGILPGSGAGIYTVSKIAAVGLMEELRHELRESNIGTSAFIPGLTTTNIGQSETHRPDSLKNEALPAAASAAPRAAAGGTGAPRNAPARAAVSPAWTRPQDPVVVGRFVLDGILHNDLFIVLQPEYRVGVEARCNALLESMVPFTPLPDSMKNGNYLRTPIFAQEIAHRRATQKREIKGT
ncbi:MAG TPA: SDR family NAD(P)-dependent oxidoreductase [Steroidobacteraceae bacterium]|nr:SDR family NAD(P)-dependent oxidoreductase [Steroidobacteraceae bacterium]